MSDRLLELIGALGEAVDRRSSLLDSAASGLLTLLKADFSQQGAGSDDVDAIGGVISSAVEELAEAFDLTELDLRILVVAAAADWDIRIAGLYGSLLGDAAPSRPSCGLVLELADRNAFAADARHRLSPDGPLQRCSLLHVDGDGPWLWRPVRVPDRVCAYLLGDSTVPSIVDDITIGAPGPITDTARTVGAALQSGIHLVHITAEAPREVAYLGRAAFTSLQVQCITVDLARAPATVRPATLLAEVVREAALQRAGLVVTGIDQLLSDDPHALKIVERGPMPAVIIDALRWDSDWSSRAVWTVAATPATRATRERWWKDAVPHLKRSDDDPDWADLMTMRVNPEDIIMAVRSAELSASLTGAGEPTAADLKEAVRASGSRALTRAALRIRPRALISDMVVTATTRAELQDLIDWGRNRDALFAAGALAGKGTKGRGLTALFAGAPGTGKTLAAEAVAGELGLDLYVVDISNVVDKYIGETEKNLEALIREAENLNVVLFFDEADALFGSRAGVRDARDRYANQGVSYLLQRIERFNGIAILATNLRGNIDPAFARRLHHIVTFTDPDPAARHALWETHLDEAGELDPQDPIDLEWLSQHFEVTGGTIRNIVMAAAFAAAAGGQPVGMRHVRSAIRREYSKLGRRVDDVLLDG